MAQTALKSVSFEGNAKNLLGDDQRTSLLGGGGTDTRTPPPTSLCR